jgi:hypothetical protein
MHATSHAYVVMLLDARLKRLDVASIAATTTAARGLAPPQPDDELKLPDFNLEYFSDDSKFDEWNTTFIADVDAEEKAERGADEQFEGDSGASGDPSLLQHAA